MCFVVSIIIVINFSHLVFTLFYFVSVGSFGVQPQVPYQGQLLSMQLSANQSLARQQLLSQNIPNNIPPASGLPQTPIPSTVS